MSFSGWKGLISVKWCDFLNWSDCSCSFTFLTYPYYWWLFIKTCHWVNISWKDQQSSLQCCLSVEIFGQKYCDIYSFYHLSCSHHNKSVTTMSVTTMTWLIIIDIDQYETSLSWQVFQLYRPGLLQGVYNDFNLNCSLLHHTDLFRIACATHRPVSDYKLTD